MDNPLISIIIVNWNAGKYLNDCIISLKNQTYKNYEIILVDNASSDNSIEFVKKHFSDICIIENKENLGFAEGNNVGIRNSKGEIIALFNPDAVADKNWLSNLIPILYSSDKIAASSGKMYYLGDKYGKDKIFCTWPKIDAITAMPFNYNDDEPFSKVDYLSGAAMVVKRDVVDKIGLLDKDYFLYFEETDWCARMIRAGYDLVYTPNALVWHAVSVTISESDKKIYYMERSRIRFAIKNFDHSYLLAFSIIFIAETFFIFFRDFKNGNSTRIRIRMHAIFWNLRNTVHTLCRRKHDMAVLKKNGKLRSYNRSLPLKTLKGRGFGL